MNPQDPLAALQPLRQPEAISGWPPAPGWWLLALFVAACLALLMWFCVRRYRANAYRRNALQQLQRLHQQYNGGNETQRWMAQINALLKRTALQAYPAQNIASSSGQQWIDFLNDTAPAGSPFPAELATAHYQRDTRIDMEALEQVARAWIRKHRRVA
tara:strand:+ start:124998 stop:125471 length:474 start_codon:yes stop_codon:yes gene_type:complete